jgi:hypothetical protein
MAKREGTSDPLALSFAPTNLIWWVYLVSVYEIHTYIQLMNIVFPAIIEHWH